LPKITRNLNLTKVYELLIYHDLVEIETGDVALDPENPDEIKEKDEITYAKKLAEKLPTSISEKFLKNFKEFEEQKTIESKFAKAINQLDAVIQEIDFKEDWKGWSKEFLIQKKAKYFKEFPEVEKHFYSLLDYLEKEGYFSQ